MAELARAGRYARAGARWARLLVAGRPDAGVRVFYGHDRVPGPGEPVAGGTAKFQRLATRFPNHPTDFSVLYLGSTWLPRDLRPLLRLVRRRAVPLGQGLFRMHAAAVVHASKPEIDDHFDIVRPMFQSFVNQAYTQVATGTLLAGGAYYEESWTAMSLLMMTGNFLNYTTY